MSYKLLVRSLPNDAIIAYKKLLISDFESKFAIGLFILFVIIVTFFLFKLRKQEERIRASEQITATQQSFQTLVDTMPIALRITDEETGKIVYVNRKCVELFGYKTPEDMCGKKLIDMLPVVQSDGTDVKFKLSQIKTGKESDSIDIEYVRNDGCIIDANVIAFGIDYRGRNSRIGIITDLAERRTYEKMLRDTAQKEKEASELKSRFLVNMSHEIRTPMNAIIGLTDIELRKQLEKKTRETYIKINTSAQNLLRIINDILDLSKIEANKIEIYEEEFELEEMISSALLVVTPRLDGKNVEFVLDASLNLPRYVIGDRIRMWQILKNFLDNSAKYTEEGEIILSVFIDKKRSNKDTIYLSFIIIDTGIGIENEQIKKLFVPYTQIYNDAQKKYKGTGLGMVISKRLCELMGGEMEVESRIGEGTTISLNIPFKRSYNKEIGLNAVHTHDLSNAKMLIVDNDDISLTIMSELIKGSGASYEMVHSGEEALDVIFKYRDRGESFDIVLLDYRMEGMSGVETAKRIQESLSKVPKLLMVTAYQRMLIMQDLERYHIFDVIEKPFIPSQFMKKIYLALEYKEDTLENKKNSFPQFKDVNILLCEDYFLNQEVAVGMLEQFGVEITVAEDGKKGLEALNTGKPFDLIFMDLQMPIMDGYETTRCIRKDSRFEKIPIVSLTADAMKEVAEKCIKIGMNDHVPKPIEFERLQEVLLKWLPKDKRVEENPH